MADRQRADPVSLDQDVELAEQHEADEPADCADDHRADNAQGPDIRQIGGGPARDSADSSHDRNRVDTADQTTHLLGMRIGALAKPIRSGNGTGTMPLRDLRLARPHRRGYRVACRRNFPAWYAVQSDR